MSLHFRDVIVNGTPRQILKALRNKKYSLDHEDIVLCLQTLLELVDGLAEDQEKLKNSLIKGNDHAN